MSDDARDLFNIEIDEFQKKAKVSAATDCSCNGAN